MTTTTRLTPADLAQGQLEAYNAQDVDALCGFFADDLIVLSEAFGRVLCEDYGVEAGRIHVVPGGVDAARFDVFRLLDATLNGQPAQAARMLAGLRAEGEAIPALMGMIVMELTRAASLAQVQARGGNLNAEFRAQRVWDSKQAVYTRALQRHPAPRWDQFLAAAGRIDRIAKGRAPGDAWQALERLLVAVAEPRAASLLA